MPLNTNNQQLKDKPDKDWIRQALFVPTRSSLPNANSRAREMNNAYQFSYSSLNIADTSLGGNRSINPKPQFTRYADLNLPSLLVGLTRNGKPDKNQSMGMGRYYSEVIDNNAQRIHMQFGVPAYNSLTNFFTTFYDPAYGNMANAGVIGGSGFLNTVGKFIGFITIWSVVPELALTSLLYGTAKKAYKDLRNRPMSKFYYMKPTMTLYWSTVITIVNAIAVNMKLVQGVFPTDLTRVEGEQVKLDASKYGQSAADIRELSRILPDIMLNDNGGIDIRHVANRYQRLKDEQDRILLDIREKATTEDEAIAAIQSYIKQGNGGGDKTMPINDYMKNYAGSASGLGKHLYDELTVDYDAQPADKQPDTSASEGALADISNAAARAVSYGATTLKKLWTGITEHLDDYGDFTIAEGRQGSAFVSFIVDYDSHVQESFENTTRESDIASKMNETSRSGREKLFNIANGNVGDGIIADTLESVVSGVGSLLSGAASSLGFSGLAMLGGKTFVDIPEYWDSSRTSFPSSNYTIELRTPYGNPISILTQIIVPTAMLIAGAAARTTGKNSYTGPFLCKLWQKGRTQIQLGMITSLTLTRGAGNVGWNINQQPIGIDINFTVTNLSKLLHVPITSELSLSDAFGITIFDEDTNFTDYMAILGSLGLTEQYYPSSRWKLRANKIYTNFKEFTSVDHLLQWGVENAIPGQLFAFASKRGQLD